MEMNRRTWEVKQEARFAHSQLLDPALSGFLGANVPKRAKDRKRLELLRTGLKDRIYIEAVYALTHVLISEPVQAESMFRNLLAHREHLAQHLGRDVGIQVAALDYMQNLRGMLKNPTVIEFEKCRAFAAQAILDSTTLSFDKELFESDLKAECERSDRFGECLCVLFLDIDHLKAINDRYGHTTGTRAIVQVAQCIKTVLRKYDSVYRYGGDEFLVLLPQADCHHAQSIARRIQRAIRRKRLSEFPALPGISIGIAQYGKEGLREIHRVVEAADRALYRAKQDGRDTIRIHGSERERSLNSRASPPLRPLRPRTPPAFSC